MAASAAADCDADVPRPSSLAEAPGTWPTWVIGATALPGGVPPWLTSPPEPGRAAPAPVVKKRQELV